MGNRLVFFFVFFCIFLYFFSFLIRNVVSPTLLCVIEGGEKKINIITAPNLLKLQSQCYLNALQHCLNPTSRQENNKSMQGFLYIW